MAPNEKCQRPESKIMVKGERQEAAEKDVKKWRLDKVKRRTLVRGRP